MVSVFEGQLTRTWSYSNDENISSSQRMPDERVSKRKHIINLYHDTITGKPDSKDDVIETIKS
jgi:hypothetical protein